MKDPDYLETLQKIESYLGMKACEDGGQRAADRIRKSGLRMELKERLLEILDDENPWYFFSRKKRACHGLAPVRGPAGE